MLEEKKVGGYTVKEWREMIENKVVAKVSDEVLEFIKPNIFEKKLMEKEKNEVKPIEVFTVEQLNLLPKEARNSIVSLEQNLPSKELMVLNPMVAELFKIKELEKIKYSPLLEKASKEEIQLFKENIEKFKNAKKQITAFKKISADAKKSIKGPLDLLGKEVIKVEKSVNEIADEVLKNLETEFSDYLIEQAEATRIATEKRNAKATAAINELTEQSKAQSDMIKKGALITFLKYEMLEETKAEVNKAIEKYALPEIYKLRDELILRTFEKYSEKQDVTLLDEEELGAIKISFSNEMLTINTNLNNRIIALEALKQNEKLVDIVEATSPNAMGQVNAIEMAENGHIVFGSTQSGATPVQNIVPAMSIPEVKNYTVSEMACSKIEQCKIDIQVQMNLSENHNLQTPEFLEQLRRVRGAIKLLEKTVLYINNQLPPKVN